ncbi:MAG: MFS transporter [Promethearchaeota archaeon]
MRERKKIKLKMKYSKNEISVIIVILLLSFINVASLNMLIPSYSAIISDFGKKYSSLIYIPDSLSVLIGAFTMVIWGYYTDRLDRNKVIRWGVFLSTLGFLLTAFCNSYPLLIIARIITGGGMGFAIPVGISILSDIFPAEERSGLFGFLAIFSSISNGTGQGLSAFLGPLNILNLGWHFPFLILSVLALIAVISLAFVKLPEMGSKEESLADLQEFEELQYGYRMSRRALVSMMKKRTNKYLIINGLFSIIPGTIIIFSLITTFSHPTEGLLAVLPDEIRIQVSTLMAGVASLGYLIGSIVLSWFGDYVYNKNQKNRAILAFAVNVIAIPLCLLMIYYLRPITLSNMPNYPVEIPNDQFGYYVSQTMISIFKNYPSYILYIIFSFLGTFFSAGMVTNKNAVMVDVNLPEHRGTATSLFQLTEQLGKSFTLMLTAGLLVILSRYGMGYREMLFISILFWIPSAFLWFLSTKSVVYDIYTKEITLRERSQVSFIDYFFELNMAMDDGIQYVHDAKDILIKHPKKAEKLISEAIKKFSWIKNKAHKKMMPDIEVRVKLLEEKAKEFRKELASLLKENPESEKQLKEFSEKIASNWPESDLKNIELLEESAYLKVIEARLGRNFNPIESSQSLQNAIEIYDRVINLCSDRIIEEGIKKLSPEEENLQERIHQLLVKAQKSKSNTELLRSKLNQIVNTVLKEDISRDELSSLFELTTDYNLKMTYVVEDTFDRRLWRKFSRVMREIDDLFEEYDEWQNQE